MTFLKNNKVYSGSLALLFTFMGLCLANASEAVVLDGVDITPVVTEFQKSVVTFKTPIKFYHWFQGAPNSIWQQPLPTKSADGLNFVRNNSLKYWSEYGKDAPGQMYGYGLYAAVDPWATHEYGGENWVLVQIQVPAGLKVLDVTKSSMTQTITPQLSNILDQFHCGNLNSLSDLLRGGNPRAVTAGEPCKKLTEKISREVLQVKGFLYSYYSAYLTDCLSDGSRKSAVVITENDWINANNVKVFNSSTADDKPERISIQSLFYKVASDATTSTEAYGRLEAKRDEEEIKKQISALYPGFSFMAITGNCGKQTSICDLNVWILNHQTRETKKVPLPPPSPIQYASQISGTNLPLGLKPNIKGLLWNDLDGTQTDPQISSWIKQNLLGCSANQVTP
jgi:hypothetical protein